ncbi:MAG: hypothetical protein ACXAEU_14465 [Candidatus Hodarchaeales archaeon]|jgi:hypothetical protein
MAKLFDELFDEAEEAANELEILYDSKDWWAGVSVEYDEKAKQFFICLRVNSNDSLSLIDNITGVPIRLRYQQIPRALSDADVA